MSVYTVRTECIAFGIISVLILKKTTIMLKFLQENLSVGCFVEVETPNGIAQGSISAILADRLELLTDGKRHQYFEEHLLAVKYVSDEQDAYQDCYIQKFIPDEKCGGYFWGENHDGTLGCTNYDNIITIYTGRNMRCQRGHLELPDMIDVEDNYYYVEVLSSSYMDSFSDDITSVKLPKQLKSVEPIFVDRNFIQKIYVPDSLVYAGGYKIGGCITCQVFDLNGKPLDWEFEEDW